jgi:oligopeptide transport system substrate-binding protein
MPKANARFVQSLLLLAALSLSSVACNKTKKDSPNTLHLWSEAKIKGLDPIMADDIYADEQVKYAYESLLQYSYLKRPFQVEPALAEAMPQVSADGKTYTIRIKKGVVFQDDPCFKESGGKGRELTAEDFIYSWKRLSDPKSTSPGFWVVDGKIVGLNAWRDEASKAGAVDYSKAIEGLKALDHYTLQITLVKRSAQFMFNLAQQFMAVVPHEAVELYGKEFQNHAVGTGPFRVQEFNGASKIVWVRNPTYRKEFYPSEGMPGDKEAGLLEDAGKPIPFADKLVTQVFEEKQPMWLTFLSGRLDRATIPKDSFDQAVGPNKELKPELKGKGIVMYMNPDPEFTRMTFNMADPLFAKNKYLRQAISLAYDASQVIQIFYNGRAIPAQGPIPPGLAGYDESFKSPYRQFDLAKAKELLAKAGYPNGEGLPQLEYLTLSDSTSRQFSELDAKMLGAIGVKLKINVYSWPEYQAAVKNRRGQLIAGSAWTADYPDAENFLQLYYSKNAPPGANDGSYSNPEYDKLYEKALTMMDSPERLVVYKKMVDLLVEDCPAIFVAHRVSYSLVQPWLKNFKRTTFDHAFAKYLRVDVKAAEESRP